MESKFFSDSVVTNQKIHLDCLALTDLAFPENVSHVTSALLCRKSAIQNLLKTQLDQCLYGHKDFTGFSHRSRVVLWCYTVFTFWK